MACNLFHINYALPTKVASCQTVICFSLRGILTILLLPRLLVGRFPLTAKFQIREEVTRGTLFPGLQVNSLCIIRSWVSSPRSPFLSLRGTLVLPGLVLFVSERGQRVHYSLTLGEKFLRRERSSLHRQAAPTPLPLLLYCHGNVSALNEKQSIFLLLLLNEFFGPNSILLCSSCCH